MRELLARHRQFLVFLTGGVLSALIDVGLMQGLIWSGLHYVLATSAGFLTGLLFNYAFHAKLTFRHAPTAHSFARYLTLVAANYLFTLGCVSASVAWLGIAVVGKLVSLPIIAVNGYVLGKRWIFK